MPATSAATNRYAGSWLVITALCFNMVFCFINTRGIHISSTTVIICEMMILAVGLYAAREQVSQQAVRISLIMIIFVAGMKLVNPGLNVKILHDIAIIYVFYELGTLVDMQDGNRLLWIIMAIVVPIGLFELLLPDLYGSMFNIWSYYVVKGTITATTINYSNTTAFISGVRGGQLSRTFFPSLLGVRRISSVFLEPVSMGNFSVIAFAWCLSTEVGKPVMRWLLLALAAFCFVLGDSRFALACWILMLVFRAIPLCRSRFAIFCLPVLTMLALLINGSLHEIPGVLPSITNDNFPGRLLFSGRLLDYWGWSQWFGLTPSQVYTADTGYAYAINNLGLVFALFLLGVFAFHMPKTQEAMHFKAMITVYMATSLSIGSNMFSIKTAALCWFLYGATNAVPSFRRVADEGLTAV